MCVRCHFCPVSAYLLFLDFVEPLILSGTPQRGFCIHLEYVGKFFFNYAFKIFSFSLELPFYDDKKRWSELVGSLLGHWVTTAKGKENGCKTLLNYLYSTTVLLIRTTSFNTTTVQTQYNGKNISSHLRVISLHDHAKREEEKVLKTFTWCFRWGDGGGGRKKICICPSAAL